MTNDQASCPYCHEPMTVSCFERMPPQFWRRNFTAWTRCLRCGCCGPMVYGLTRQEAEERAVQAVKGAEHL